MQSLLPAFCDKPISVLQYLMIGYKPRTLPSVIFDTTIPAIESCLKTLSAARNEALATHELAQQVMAT